MTKRIERAPSWLHADGEQATVDSLAAVFAVNSAELASQGPGLYVSEDMSKGIDLERLKAWDALLIAVMRLDTRGGLFRQVHIVQGIKQGLNAEDYARLLENTLDRFGLPPNEVIELLSYKIRCMTSHCRILFDSCSDHKGHVLKDVFKVMKDTPKDSWRKYTTITTTSTITATPGPPHSESG